MKVLFIHRSVGQNMLEDSRLRYKLESENIGLYDVNANKCRFTNSGGLIEESPFPIEEGKTDPEDLAKFFANAKTDGYEKALNSFDCIIFKSCYTANSIKNEKRLESQINAYKSIQAYIETHPSQYFIVCTSPPRTLMCTTRKAVKNAKMVQEWIIENLSKFPNTNILDIYGILADEKGVLDKKYRRFGFYDQHPNRQGSKAIATELEKLLKSMQQAQKQARLKSVA